MTSAVFRSRARSGRFFVLFLFFLLTVNISHTIQAIDVVWGFRITDGGVYTGWVFFIDMEVETTVHPLMTSTPQEKMLFKRHLCPECGKSYVKKKILLRHRKQHHLVYLVQNVTRQEIYYVWWYSFSYEQCSSEDKNPVSVRRARIQKSVPHKRSLEPGGHSCKVNA